jgi:2-oxoacid:acceptor oxidoreductase gamma subunit (pyruvate/2-ketoisovalerate family)
MNAEQKLRSRLAQGGCIDLRGHGKAGGGLVLAVQSFGSAVAEVQGLDVQDWPLFSSARKGANVTAYLRIAQGRVEMTSMVTEPDVVVLMNEAAAEEVDFAEGAGSALYVLNTWRSPQEAAAKWKLTGTVACVDGDELGRKYLGRPLANIAVLAALVKTTGLVDAKTARYSMVKRLEKRRMPQRVVDGNASIFDEAVSFLEIAEVNEAPAGSHRRKAFNGYGELPVAAQSALRTSSGNRTSGYGRPGVRVEFADEAHKCNGCSLCVVQCPEGIINFIPDPAKGPIVYGAKFADFCKVCRECVVACPLDLFREVAASTRPEGAVTEA